jgi:hypothetical protein
VRLGGTDKWLVSHIIVSSTAAAPVVTLPAICVLVLTAAVCVLIRSMNEVLHCYCSYIDNENANGHSLSQHFPADKWLSPSHPSITLHAHLPPPAPTGTCVVDVFTLDEGADGRVLHDAGP